MKGAAWVAKHLGPPATPRSRAKAKPVPPAKPAYRGWAWTGPVWNAARAFAAQIGVPLAARQPNPFAWDGRTLATRQPPTMVIHDLAHWLVCPPIRRTQPEFGLGGGPETRLMWVDVHNVQPGLGTLYMQGVRDKHGVDMLLGTPSGLAFRTATPKQIGFEETSVCIVNTLLCLELGQSPEYDINDMQMNYGPYSGTHEGHHDLVLRLIARGVLDRDMRVQWPQRPVARPRLSAWRWPTFARVCGRQLPWNAWIWWKSRQPSRVTS